MVHATVQAADGGVGWPNALPLLPHPAEMVIGLIAFAILYWVFAKKVVPRMEDLYARRTEAIQGGIETAEAAQRGAHLVANERQEHRARLVARSVRAVPPGARTVLVGDGTRPAWAPESFDRVLVDVPCTGLGALRRRPEARWRRTPGDVGSLVPLQRELLGAALDAARPGAVVLYATCSPHTAETLEVLWDVLEARRDAEVLDTAATARAVALPGALEAGRDPGRQWPGGGTSVQLWPHVHGTDAMFMVALRKTR